MIALSRPPLRPRRLAPRTIRSVQWLRPSGLRWMMAAELFALAMGFAVMVRLARVLGPSAFARLEYASAVAAWLLVVVRGGIDLIVQREAARRPNLIGPLTDILIGLRCASAAIGYAIVIVLAVLLGPDRGPIVAVMGLILLPSAFQADLGFRASGRLGPLAFSQAVRALGAAALASSLVRGATDVLVAACCSVAAELIAAVIPYVLHAREYGLARPRFRRRAWVVLARRGAIAGLTRFGRVSLYGADLLALGWWAGPELGTYAAARRLVFGLVALGLVVPATVSPAIARAWASGAPLARRLIEQTTARLWALALPAALGLGLTADRWMPLLFGEKYRAGGPLLAVVAARLPWLLVASFDQAALVACRRETWVLEQMILLSLLALILVPSAALVAGPWGVGWAALAIEVVGVVGGWRRLRRLHVAPPWHHQAAAPLAACLMMIGVCLATRSWPLPLTVLAAALSYGATGHFLRSPGLSSNRRPELA